ncbi:MAG: trypsin-like peptidase domain-containing protein [Anaerolineales bacterium]|nr:trypsin-like peptidase domain-containing protein [Anaerolineales bacterium]
MKPLSRISIVILLILLTISLWACSPSLKLIPAVFPASKEANLQYQANDNTSSLTAYSSGQNDAASPMAYPASATGTTSTTADLEASLVALYQKANPSVVYIITSNGTSGSGFVYDAKGYLVTNYHVITGARSLEVAFASGERVPASVAGYDVDSDLAVLWVEEMPQGIHALPLAAPESIQVGQFVAAIGNPYGETGSMSFGIISGLGRSLPSQRNLYSGSTYSLPDVIQTDAPINPGNSGGPLLNMDGGVIGITAAIASDTGSNTGVGFAIPVQAILAVVPDLIANGKHDYAYIGAGFDGEITLSEQTTYGLGQTQGAYVISVTPGSPAEKAGLIAANPNTGRGGDLIIAIDGITVNTFTDLNRILVFNTRAGQTVELTILRNGQTISLPLTLASRP